MGLNLLEKITDNYERKARLYPALLLVMPILAMASGVYGVELQLKAAGVGLLAAFGVFYLAASIVREFGKRVEESLFSDWGGKPTTQLLRHRDSAIDPITKARYHRFLSKHMSISFPTKEDEEKNPVQADEVYQSATRWLLDRTRDKKTFALLFEENIAFGFRRNCLGVKPFAIVVCIIMLFWPLVHAKIVTSGGVSIENIENLTFGAWSSLAASSLMLLIWIFFFTKRTVKTAAFGYADFLFRACDVLPKKK